MITSTVLAVFFVPVFYVAVQGLIELLNGPPRPNSPQGPLPLPVLPPEAKPIGQPAHEPDGESRKMTGDESTGIRAAAPNRESADSSTRGEQSDPPMKPDESQP
jgi:hypothetical protein